jgi:hypothetical protein
VTGYELDGWYSIPSRAGDFFLLHSVQTVSGIHPASYYPESKVKVNLSL